MDRIGRILEWQAGVATVEVGRNQECASGSCADCHASAADRTRLQVPWKEQPVLGLRVLVKPRGEVFRLVRWLGALAVFCLTLFLAVWIVPVAAEAGAAQRVSILAGLFFAAVAWRFLRAWARKRPQFRVIPLERPFTSRRAAAQAAAQPESPESSQFVSEAEVTRWDRR